MDRLVKGIWKHREVFYEMMPGLRKNPEDCMKIA